MKIITAEELILHVSLNKPCIDVRAPIEFIQGSIPDSINYPILNDQERSLIGTCYKKNGQDQAIQLGHKIVSGQNKEDKIYSWSDFILKNPETVVTCFRGGLRSRTTQNFLLEKKIDIPRVEGGYKSVRQLYLDLINQFCSSDLQHKVKILTGETGSAKTDLIKTCSALFPTIDLENHASHKGSAFGKINKPQPSQATFENFIAQNIFNLKSHSFKNKGVLIEDESRVIGSVHLPENLFHLIRNSNVIQIQESLEFRINKICSEYVLDSVEVYDDFQKSILKIQKKLGGLRTQEILSDIQKAQNLYMNCQSKELNKVWIEKILIWYYDPMYRSSFNIRNPKVEFKGSLSEVQSYLSQ